LSSGAASGEKSPDSDIEIPTTSGGFEDDAPAEPLIRTLPNVASSAAAPEKTRRRAVCDRLML
jgi:hypothetical protein